MIEISSWCCLFSQQSCLFPLPEEIVWNSPFLLNDNEHQQFRQTSSVANEMTQAGSKRSSVACTGSRRIIPADSRKGDGLAVSDTCLEGYVATWKCGWWLFLIRLSAANNNNRILILWIQKFQIIHVFLSAWGLGIEQPKHSGDNIIKRIS